MMEKYWWDVPAIMSAMKPMPFARSLAYFLIPAAFLGLLLWKFLPFLDRWGKPLLYTFTGTLAVVSIILWRLALRKFRKEKNGAPQTMRERFRLRGISGADWLWTLGLAGFLLLCQHFLEPATEYIRLNWFNPPKYFFRLYDSVPGFLMEVAISKNWIASIYFLIFGCVIVACEEFYFRGYLLPRQQLSAQHLAWLLHALLFTVYLCVLPWELPRALPIAMALALTAQMRQSTSVTIVARCLLVLSVLLWRMME